MPDTAAPAADSQPVEVHAAGTPLTGLGTLAVGVIAIAALYFGREVFVPMALALLLSFALGPPVMLLCAVGTSIACSRSWSWSPSP